MGQITATRNLVATKVVRLAGQWLFCVCAVLVLSVIMCSFYYFLDRVLFISSWRLRLLLGFLWPFYSFWTTHMKFLWLGNSGSATTHLPGCICLWTSSLNIGLNMLPSDSFMSCLNFLLRYFTGELQALQLIVLALFDVVDQPLAACMLVHF